ncbi:MAG: right-handed parallel beta-helix repeat-containing protein [Saprospiraceae bacterium]|nr:right-handed parallel beta-helix repeat-containing protein [Saprospiraceae bacterium]
MKKYFLFISALLVGLVLSSQNIVLHENFELPSGADTLVSSSTGSTSWGISTNYFNGGSRCDTATVSQGDTMYLTSNSFSTTGNLFVILEFAHICKIEFFDAAFIEVSNNNGLTWTKLTGTQYLGTANFATAGNKFTSTAYTQWLPANNYAVPTNSWWKLEQFDVSSLLANSAQAKVRFTLIDLNNTGAAGNYGWLIDDIKITSALDELIPPIINLIPPILLDSVFQLGPFNVNASITDASGIDTAMLIYSRNNGPADTVGMIKNTGSSYFGIIDTIPTFSLLDTICYYIIAKDSSLVVNVAREPSLGCNQFIIYNSPPPANCVAPITTFPYLQYFDSIPAYSGTPTCSSTHILPTSFGWTNETTDMTDWAPYTGATPNNPYTGPSSDHTSGSGNYMYVEASSCYTKTAFLTSACLDLTALAAPTLEFYYHMFDNYAQYMGELHIDVWYGNHWVNSIWSKQGDQGNQWNKAIVSLIPYKSVTKIRFRAITGSNAYSDIAIDDVKIWQPPANDAGVLSIDKPVSPAVTGSQTVKATFKNHGSANLTKVKIGWSVDGVSQPVYNWSGMLSPGSVADSVQIGSFNFQSGASVIKAWTFSPNDSIDGWNPNDTAMSSIIACVGNLNGVFSIGGPSPDFVSFNDALFALNYCGIDSHVVINVYPGTYDEQLVFDSIPGLSATSTITFQGISGDSTDAVLEFAASNTNNNYVIKFDGAKYITFRKITIKAKGSSYAYVIHMTNGAEHNTIENCVVKSNVTSTSSYGRCIVLYTGLVNQYNTIRNNVIEGGYYGIYIYGSGSTSRARGNIIEGNEISNFYYYAMMLYYQDSVQVIGNYIHDGNSATQYGIYTYYVFDGFRIERNKVILSPTSSGTGMRVYYANYNSYITSTTLAGTVANNFISITSGTSTNYGLYAYYSNKVNYYFNSINVSSGSATSRAMYQGNTTSNAFGQSFVNNIFSNSAGGYAAYFYTPATLGTLDYNNYYTSGTNLAYWTGPGDLLNLNALKSASGQDIHSKDVDPGFTSVSDLHLANTNLAAAGTAIPGIGEDIDGDFRNPGAPTIGADELPPIPIDAGVTKVLSPTVLESEGVSLPVKVVIRNFGTDTILGMDVKYYLNGSSNVVYNFTSTLLPGQEDTITFPNITITPGHNHLYAFTALANDTNTFNDTLYFYYYGRPILDMGAVQLLQPDSGGCFTSAETVKVRIKNFGSQAITFSQKPTTITVTATGPNPTTFAPIVINTGSLAVGGTQDVLITNNFDMSQTGVYTFKISTSVTGDGDTSNDTIISKGITVFSIVTTFPFFDDFETFTVGSGTYDPGNFDNGWSGDPHVNAYNNFQWVVNSGGTPSTGTGPANDHTTGTATGKYLYTEGNYGSTGASAFLISPCIDLSSFTNPSLRFWYHTFGANCNSIRVDVLYNGAWTLTVGIIYGQQMTSETDPWKQAVVDLTGYPGIVRLRFRAIKGSGTYADMAIDDVYINQPIPKDAAVREILKPSLNYSTVGPTQQVEVVLENHGLDTIHSMNVGYTVGNGVPVVETWTGVLPKYQSISHTFQTNFLVEAGSSKLKAFTMLPGDGNISNDTTSMEYTGVPVIQVPYSDGFEGINYFVNSGGLMQWERGIPAGATITAPHSPTNVWMTNLNANYQNNSGDFLYTPFFDFSQASSATLSFWHWMDAQLSSDGGVLQYSTNSGQTWSTLGTIGDPYGTNWFNTNIGGTNCWSGTQSGWVKSSYDLSQFDYFSIPLQFRFYFLSNATTNSYDGWAIDDFEISLPQIPFDAGVSRIIQPISYTSPGSQVSVQVKLKNYGSTTLTAIPVSYKVNTQNPVTQNWTGSLASGDSVSFSFTITFSAPISYDLCVYTSLANDSYNFNNEKCINISKDIGVSYILEPGTYTTIGANETVKIRVQNFGTDPITNLDLKYQVNATPEVSETWSGNLKPGGWMYYTFNQTFVSPMAMYNLCAFSNMADDTDPSNDKTCKYIIGTVDVKSLDNSKMSLGQNIPNPSSNLTSIPFSVPKSGNLKFTIRNLVGQELIIKNMKVKDGESFIDVDISYLSAGIYFYSIEFDGKRLVKKMVVSKQ